MQKRASGIIKEVVRSKEVFDHLREEVQIQGKLITPPPEQRYSHTLVKVQLLLSRTSLTYHLPSCSLQTDEEGVRGYFE